MSENKKLMGMGERRLCGKDTRANLREYQWPKLKYFEQKSKEILDYDPQ